MNMNQLLKSTVIVALLTFMTNISADAQRIAVVDINAILESMPAYNNAQDQLDQLAATWRREIAEEYDKIKSKYNEFQAQQVLMSAEMAKQKEDEIVKMETQVRELQRRRFGPEGELFKKRQELVRPIQEKVYRAIEDYSSDKGFDIIFDKGGSAGILFTNDRFDKTQDILDEIN